MTAKPPGFTPPLLRRYCPGCNRLDLIHPLMAIRYPLCPRCTEASR